MDKKNQTQRDRLVQKVFSAILKNLEGKGHTVDNPTARDVIGAFAAWGGKSKDEIVQVLCREIGIATAAVLKEPLNQVIENRKLQITMELVPKDKPGSQPGPKDKSKKKTTRKRKS